VSCPVMNLFRQSIVDIFSWGSRITFMPKWQSIYKLWLVYEYGELPTLQ